MDTASEKQAVDILMLDIREMSAFADYFVICSAETQRHMEALCRDIDEALAKNSVSIRSREGAPDSGWVLLDFGPVIVHVFAPREREFYQLERLWSRAMPVVRIQ